MDNPPPSAPADTQPIATLVVPPPCPYTYRGEQRRLERERGVGRREGGGGREAFTELDMGGTLSIQTPLTR